MAVLYFQEAHSKVLPIWLHKVCTHERIGPKILLSRVLGVLRGLLRKKPPKRGLGQRPKVLPHSLLCYSAEDVEDQLEKDGQRAAGYEEAEHQREDSDRLGKAGLGLIGLHG